jgi:hypothetical protein
MALSMSPFVARTNEGLEDSRRERCAILDHIVDFGA